MTRDRKKEAPPRSLASWCAVGSAWLDSVIAFPSLRCAGDAPRGGAERHILGKEVWGKLHMFLSFGSLSRSAESNTTVLLPVFFHQCETWLVSATTSPALCTIGTAQFDAYSLISPSMI